MRMKVDQDKCIQCGMCVTICPDVFKQDDETLVVSSTDLDIPEPNEINGSVSEASASSSRHEALLSTSTNQGVTDTEEAFADFEDEEDSSESSLSVFNLAMEAKESCPVEAIESF